MKECKKKYGTKISWRRKNRPIPHTNIVGIRFQILFLLFTFVDEYWADETSFENKYVYSKCFGIGKNDTKYQKYYNLFSDICLNSFSSYREQHMCVYRPAKMRVRARQRRLSQRRKNVVQNTLQAASTHARLFDPICQSSRRCVIDSFLSWQITQKSNELLSIFLESTKSNKLFINSRSNHRHIKLKQCNIIHMFSPSFDPGLLFFGYEKAKTIKVENFREIGNCSTFFFLNSKKIMFV